MRKVYAFASDEYIDPKEKIAVIAREDKSIVPHTHDFIELVYIKSGSGVHVINDRHYNISPGDLLFINYGQTHIIEADDTFELVNIIFTPEFISTSLINSANIYELFSFILSDELGNDEEFPEPIAHLTSDERARVEYIIDIMLTEYAEKIHGYHSLLKLYTQVVICLMLRNIYEHEPQLNFNRELLHKLTPKILSYITHNHAEKITLQELAENSFYSPSYFSRLFKECYGKSLSKYIKEKRISHAAELLLSTDMSVSEICKIVGYNNRQVFNKFFKQETGYTPSEYRMKADESK